MSELPSLSDLEQFLAVAEELHFGRAAERLAVATPNVSRAIRRLERQVGVSLFDRSSRSVELTKAGELYLSEARDLLARARRASRLAALAEAGEAGTIVVGFTAAAALRFVPQHVSTFRMRFPDVVIDLREIDSAEQVRAIDRGELDVGYIRPTATATCLRSIQLAVERNQVVVARTHPWAARPSISVDMFRDEPFIFFAPNVASTAGTNVFGLFERAGIVPRLVASVQTLTAAFGLVGAGYGFTIASDAYATLAPDLDFVPIAGVDSVVQLLLAWRADEDTPVVTQFTEHVRATPSREAVARSATLSIRSRH